MPPALGACLWVGITGNWPGTQNEVHGAVRAVLALIVIGTNGLASLAAAAFAAYFSGGGIVLLTFIGVFVAAAVVEMLALLLVIGVVKLGLRLGWGAHNA